MIPYKPPVCICKDCFKNGTERTFWKYKNNWYCYSCYSKDMEV